MVNTIREYIEQAARMKNAYFFTPPTSASGRRSYERYNSRPIIEWQESGHTYTAEIVVECSCKNVYVSCNYTRDGLKTNLTAVKNSLKRMEA